MIIDQLEQTGITSYFKSAWMRVMVLVSIVLNICLWLLIAWQSRYFPDTIALHYNIYFGTDLIGPWYQFFALPLIGLVILIVNGIAAYFMYRFDRLIGFFLVATAMVSQIILLMASLAIIIINL